MRFALCVPKVCGARSHQARPGEHEPHVAGHAEQGRCAGGELVKWTHFWCLLLFPAYSESHRNVYNILCYLADRLILHLIFSVCFSFLFSSVCPAQDSLFSLQHPTQAPPHRQAYCSLLCRGFTGFKWRRYKRDDLETSLYLVVTRFLPQ